MGAEAFIKDVNTLIPRPDIALEVLSLAHEADCDTARLAKLIQQDPSLTANMLRLANSAYFGHMRQINSLPDIIVRLGLDTIKMFAITGASIAFLRTPQDAYNMKPGRLWRHSYATALLASIIAEKAGHQNTAMIYSAALLHDIGKVILNKPLLQKANDNKTFWSGEKIIDYESSLLGTDHAQVGAALLWNWGLPEAISHAVGLHHLQGEIKEDDLDAKIVYVSNLLAENFGIKSNSADDNFFDAASESVEFDFLGIPKLEENIALIIEEFYERYNNSEL